MINYDYLYDKNYFKNEIGQNHLSLNEMHYNILHNAFILPNKRMDGNLGGLLTADKTFLDGTHLHRGLGGGYETDSNAVLYSDVDVVFLGMWSKIWGHCITDNIRRLWILNDKQFTTMYPDITYVYCSMDDCDVGENFCQLLSAMGLDLSRLKRVKSVSQYKNVILPDECFWCEKDGTRLFTNEYVALVNKIREYGENHFVENDCEKVYFTYSKSARYRQVGEQKIEKYFRDLGYKIIAPEDYSFVEQLNILLNCKAFSSTIGSCSHNIIFLRDNTSVCLIPRANYLTGYQLALDQIHELNITYIDSSLSLYVSKIMPWNGPFYYFVSDNLKRFFEKDNKKLKISRITFFAYKMLGCSLNRDIDPPDYYITNAKSLNVTYHEWSGSNFLYSIIRKVKLGKVVCTLINRFYHWKYS